MLIRTNMVFIIPESDSPFGIIVGVIMGILVVAGILVFLIIIRRQRKLCFKKAAVSKEDQARMKPLVPKDEVGYCRRICKYVDRQIN